MGVEVTVVIPFYNPGKYINEAIESVLQQTYSHWKMVLVNDGSTDDSVHYVQEYLNDRRISLVQHTVNSNLSKGLNTALRVVDTPYMIHLDGDDYFYPYTLEVLIREARNQGEEVALITGNINMIIQNKLGKVVKEKPKYGRIFSDRYDFLQSNTSLWPRFYRTEALRAVGGWPTDGPYEGEFVEDLNILYRLIERYRFHWVDKLLLNHRRHSSNQTNNIDLLGESVEWAVRSALIRWGDQYEAEFHTDKEGWRVVKRLIPKNE